MASIKVNLEVTELKGNDFKRLDQLQGLTPEQAVEILQLKYCCGKKKKLMISIR